MKNFSDYEDEIYTCSRCGLCQSVCPVFDITKTETTVSRGFFSLLRGIILNRLKFNKKIRKNLDKCLTCNKCKSYCPSGIDAEKIIISARIASYKYSPLWKKLVLKGLYSKFFLKFASLIKFYRLFPIFNFCTAGKILHKFLQKNILYKKQTPTQNSKLNVVIFPGCINNYFNNSSLNALKMILEKNGIKYTVPDFYCCSMPAFNIGNIKDFKKFGQQNLNKIPQSTDYILFDCATCKKAFKTYADIFTEDSKASSVLEKCKHINEFFVEQKIEIPVLDKKVFYHTPCHLDCEEQTSILLNKSDLKPVETQNHCCGSAGLFFIENNKISNLIAKKRLTEIQQSEAELIMTDCPLCRLGLIKGAFLNKFNIPIFNFAEIIATVLKK